MFKLNHISSVTDFTTFYAHYPKKVNKKKAEALWNKLSVPNRIAAFSDIQIRSSKHAQWQDKQYIPAPDVYLRNEKWTDEIIEKTTLADKQEKAEDGTILSRFWTLLRQTYGERWVKAYGEEMPFIWRKKLADMDQKDIVRIINYLASDESEWLPDLPKIMRIKRSRPFEGTYQSLPKKRDLEMCKREARKLVELLRAGA